MPAVYILYSKKLTRYYIGSCLDFESRWQDHVSKKYKTSYTSKSDDWEVFLTIEVPKYEAARMIEQHIKDMKSKIYIQNLGKYPEMKDRLISKYS